MKEEIKKIDWKESMDRFIENAIMELEKVDILNSSDRELAIYITGVANGIELAVDKLCEKKE